MPTREKCTFGKLVDLILFVTGISSAIALSLSVDSGSTIKVFSELAGMKCFTILVSLYVTVFTHRISWWIGQQISDNTTINVCFCCLYYTTLGLNSSTLEQGPVFVLVLLIFPLLLIMVVDPSVIKDIVSDFLF